ncbi:MAG: hypothetical protein ACKVZJ_10370 [Phycisphaerales bacterium]
MTQIAAHDARGIPQPVGNTPTRRAVRRGRAEMWWPWGCGGAAFLACLASPPEPTWIIPAVKGALGSAVDASSVLAGFQATGISLLLALINTAPVKRLARTGTYRKLVSYHFQTLIALLFLAVAATSMQGYLAVETNFLGWDRLVIAVGAGVVVATVACVWRISRLMFLILVDPGIHQAGL